jgi:hypothetical protein
MTDPAKTEAELPELPPTSIYREGSFTSDCMTAYGLECYRAGMAAERERCAKLCESVSRHTTAIDGESFYVATGQCAAAIRAQKEPT